MTSRFTIELQPDGKPTILTVVGSDRFSLNELLEAVAEAGEMEVARYNDERIARTLFGGAPQASVRGVYVQRGNPEVHTRLHGVTPEHFRGWRDGTLRRVRKMTRIQTDFHMASLADLAVVGAKRPSPERLAELLMNNSPGVRTLAALWMAPLVTSYMTERELTDAVEEEKQSVRREKRERRERGK